MGIFTVDNLDHAAQFPVGGIPVMRYRILPIVVALTAIFFVGCSKSGNQVQVVSAVYGVSTNFADVSYRVGDLLRLSTGFEVQPSYLQVDPMIGYNKFLVIVYEVKGQRHIFTAAEGDTVSAETLREAAR